MESLIIGPARYLKGAGILGTIGKAGRSAGIRHEIVYRGPGPQHGQKAGATMGELALMRRRYAQR